MSRFTERLGVQTMVVGALLVVALIMSTFINQILDTARWPATLAMIGASAVLLILAYLLLGRLVARPVERLAGEIADALGSSADVRVPNEVATLEQAVAALIASTASNGETSVAVASRLPAMWIQLDPDLYVIDSRVAADDGGGWVALEIETLADLLSDGVVEHVGQAIASLSPGNTEAFEFSVGHREYLAELTSHDHETFELAISETEFAPAAIRAREVTPGEDVLDELLGELPFTLLELDARGVVQWANSPYLGASPEELTGKPLAEMLPTDGATTGKRAIREALSSGEPVRFVVDLETAGGTRRWTHTVVRYGDGAAERLLVAAIEIPLPEAQEVDPAVAQRLEEQLWSAQLRVSELEDQVEQLGAQLVEVEQVGQRDEEALAATRALLLEPVRAVVRASLGAGPVDMPGVSRAQSDSLRAAVEQLAATFDAEFGTALAETIETGVEHAEERFHIATFLDEIAIEMSKVAHQREARISVRVQPSLPRWLKGNVAATRAAIYQMIEIARLVASDRPLGLAARQDTSTGRSVQVRFEVEFPPPQLNEEALEVVRGCLSGDSAALSGPLAELADFNPLDLELVTIDGQATVLRCSNAFEVAEEQDTDHSWVRGLRTLIVQEPGKTENGVQAALAAFGIIGYVVADEKGLIEALHVAEEYSNPYRFVLADVDTPELESFIGQLFDGDAPVVLVGQASESAMVGALSAGYDGYLAKPVRQLDLLEVILSTVEPPSQNGARMSRADAA